MASPSKVYLTVEDTGIFKFKPQTSEAAAKTSELLQENHEVRSIDLNVRYITKSLTWPETSHLLQ